MAVTTPASAVPTLRIYDPPGLPLCWVVEDESDDTWWIVPAVDDGWARRTPYRGHRNELEPVPGYCYFGIGVPMRRPWAEVCRDPSGRN